MTAVYFGTSIPGIVQALDAKSGAPRYQLPAGTSVFASMTIAGNTLCFGNFGGSLTTVDLATQKPVRGFQTKGAKQNAGALLQEDGSFKFEAIFLRRIFSMTTWSSRFPGFRRWVRSCLCLYALR